MPLIIYLDTQDYINIFNEKDNGPNHRTLAELMSYRDNGEIILGFSFATVMEFITKPDVANRPDRVRRGQLIKDICGKNAFPYPSDLALGAVFPNEGMWMFRAGEKVTSASNFRNEIHSALLVELGKTDELNRKQRRQLGRKSSVAELMRTVGSTWGRKRSDWGEIPVSDELLESRFVERFIKGQCSDQEFESRMNAWFSDPAEYSRIFYDYADHPNVISKYFGKATDQIEQVVAAIQDLRKSLQAVNSERLAARNNLVELGLDRSAARKLTKQIQFPELSPETVNHRLEALIGQGRAGHFTHYLLTVARTNYSFKRSDVMDLMQMCYTYDCNLFRCDKAMADTFRDYEPFKGKLVSRFEELPLRIAAGLGLCSPEVR
jgi:hypothetical protein